MAVIDPEHMLHLQGLATALGRRLEPITRKPSVRATTDIAAIMDGAIGDIQSMLFAALRAKGQVSALVAYIGRTVGEFATAEEPLTLCPAHFKLAIEQSYYTEIALSDQKADEICTLCLRDAAHPFTTARRPT